jgi:hypothetical protein
MTYSFNSEAKLELKVFNEKQKINFDLNFKQKKAF